MATLGIEMCDAGFQAASCHDGNAKCISIADADGIVDWPGFAYHDGQKFVFGRGPHPMGATGP